MNLQPLICLIHLRCAARLNPPPPPTPSIRVHQNSSEIIMSKPPTKPTFKHSLGKFVNAAYFIEALQQSSGTGHAVEEIAVSNAITAAVKIVEKRNSCFPCRPPSRPATNSSGGSARAEPRPTTADEKPSKSFLGHAVNDNIQMFLAEAIGRFAFKAKWSEWQQAKNTAAQLLLPIAKDS